MRPALQGPRVSAAAFTVLVAVCAVCAVCAAVFQVCAAAVAAFGASFAACTDPFGVSFLFSGCCSLCCCLYNLLLLVRRSLFVLNPTLADSDLPKCQEQFYN